MAESRANSICFWEIRQTEKKKILWERVPIPGTVSNFSPHSISKVRPEMTWVVFLGLNVSRLPLLSLLPFSLPLTSTNRPWTRWWHTLTLCFFFFALFTRHAHPFSLCLLSPPIFPLYFKFLRFLLGRKRFSPHRPYPGFGGRLANISSSHSITTRRQLCNFPLLARIPKGPPPNHHISNLRRPRWWKAAAKGPTTLCVVAKRSHTHTHTTHDGGEWCAKYRVVGHRNY